MHSELTLLEQLKTGQIWDFPGGIHPPERKHLSNQGEINTCKLSSHYFVPLKQHIGASGELIVQVGDHVLKGQPLTQPVSGLSLPIHAPTSGKVLNIKRHVSAHPSGAAEPTLVIEADGYDTPTEYTPLTNWKSLEKVELTNHLQAMGIAGLGGAAFPTYTKANTPKPIELLIINAVECEPYITADDMLMRYHVEEIISGITILLHTTGAKHCLIAIEDNKPEAIEIMTQATESYKNIDVRNVPTKYPSGGEKQLIQILTNQQVPSKGLPIDLGIVMQNVGTAFAIKQAVLDGKPLIERVVTVTGESITNPQNLWTRFGTPVKELIEYCEIIPDKKQQRLIMGGPMMGFSIMDAEMPVVKATNCILAPSNYHLPPRGVEQACIRCSDCADACPAELLPQQLLWYSKSKEHDKLNEYNLFDCIECGACAYVCPSQIPLVQYYRNSKADIRQTEEDKAKAEKAKIRFEQRQERLEREKEARLKRHKEASERRKQAMSKDDSAKDKIAAALARAKAKKQQTAPPDTANDINSKTSEPEIANAEVAAPKDKVAAAIARAKAKKAQQVLKQTNTDIQKEVAPKSDTPKTEALNTTTESTTAEPPPEQLKKEKIAATIAKAKAKKAQNNTSTSTVKTEALDTTTESTAAEKSPEQLKKEKVAAAIAKAKARAAEKKAALSVNKSLESQEQGKD